MTGDPRAWFLPALMTLPAVVMLLEDLQNMDNKEIFLIIEELLHATILLMPRTLDKILNTISVSYL